MHFLYLRVFSLPVTYLVLKDVWDIRNAVSREMRGKYFGVFDVTHSRLLYWTKRVATTVHLILSLQPKIILHSLRYEKTSWITEVEVMCLENKGRTVTMVFAVMVICMLCIFAIENDNKKAPVKLKEICHDREINVVTIQLQYYSRSTESSQRTSKEAWKI